MKVILLENIQKLGSIGEIINVKRGYARNFLIAKKKALFASKENVKEVDKIKTELSKKDMEKKKAAKEIYEKLKNKQLLIKKLSTENKELYGSVKPTEISKIILEKIQKKTYEIKKLSTENKELYGSVKPTEISKLINEKENIEINPSNIQPSKEIKSLGEFKVVTNLHSDVQTQITVKVVPQEEIK